VRKKKSKIIINIHTKHAIYLVWDILFSAINLMMPLPYTPPGDLLGRGFLSGYPIIIFKHNFTFIFIIVKGQSLEAEFYIIYQK